MSRSSETSRVAGQGFLGMEALLPGQDHEYETRITLGDGTVVTGRGITAEEAERIASEKADMEEDDD